MFAVIALSTPLLADPPAVQIDEALAGANGDTRIQFIELKLLSPADALWGPQSGESEGRLRLLFFDATGAEIGEYVFPSDAPVGVLDPINGGYSVLLATQAFADIPGMPPPDFIIPKSLIVQNGKVCFTGNPDNPNAPMLNLCLSYGNFVGDPGSDTLGQPAGSPAGALPSTGTTSLKRSSNFNNYGTGQFNANFSTGTASPRNSDGSTGTIPSATNVNQGRNLFLLETFEGNGRTCATCHQADILFGLSPAKISFLPPGDPMFVAQWDPNLSELENTCLLVGSRGVNLENIDGFENPPVFRGSPALVNLQLTAPYGRSGEFTSLQAFSTGAVLQHMPKTLVRNTDPSAGPIDCRLPTSAELSAMEAFMLSIKLPSNGNYIISNMTNAAIARGADAAAIARGQDLFFGVTGNAKCFLCHSGPVFALAAPELGGGTQSFNSGVGNLPINLTFPEACLNGQPMPQEDGGNRVFSTPQLIGVARTAPYFHNNAVPTLHDAVAFYAGPEFNTSPAAQNPLIGTISMTAQEIEDIVVFLTALDEPFVDCDLDTIDDRVEIAGGEADCNANHVLDACELAGRDCNANGIPDECDLAPITLNSPASTASTSGGFFVHACDIDGDGDTDLLVPGWLGTHLDVLLNDGSGTSFSPGGTFAVSSYPRSVATGDFDGDGDLDAAVSNLLANHVTILMNNGIDMKDQWLGFSNGAQIDMNVPAQKNGGSLFVRAADVSGDGLPDLVVCKAFMNEVAIVLNLGPDGKMVWQGFAAPTDISTGGQTPWSASIGDISGDLLPDIVVANQLSDNVSVLLNLGGGAFGAASTYAVQDSPESVVVADVNGDALSDVIVANAESDTLSLFVATPGGVLGAPQTLVVGNYPFGAQPHSVVAGDVDRDGDLDLVIANKETSNISVLLNEGNGTFGTLVNMPWDGAPDYAVLADLDNDTFLDIAAVEYSTAMVSVSLNSTPPFGNDCNANGTPDSCDLSSGAETDLNMNQILDSCEMLGDLNVDGAVNLIDGDILVNVLIGVDTNETHIARSDLNGDAAGNGLDIQFFLTMLYAAN